MPVKWTERPRTHRWTIKQVGLVGLIGMALSGEAAGQERRNTFQTGNDLLENCQKSSPPEANFCVGYVAGVADAMTETRSTAFGPASRLA